MQFPGGARLALGVVFDSDFGASLESLLALDLLFALDNRNECRVIATTTNLHSLESAQLLQVVGRTFGARPYPIGMNTKRAQFPVNPVMAAAHSGQQSTLQTVIDTAEPHNVIRNALTAVHDGNAIVISTGLADNLADLINLPTAKEVVAAKVKALYLTGENPKPIPGWPSPTVLVPDSMAAALQFAPKPEAYQWLETHPTSQALKAQTTLRKGVLLAILHAIRGKDVSLPPASLTGVDAMLAELVGSKPIPRQRMRGFNP
jgi:hypothetical protein